jgi:hypothetical protein
MTPNALPFPYYFLSLGEREGNNRVIGGNRKKNPIIDH